jgi:hypothetical protein
MSTINKAHHFLRKLLGLKMNNSAAKKEVDHVNGFDALVSVCRDLLDVGLDALLESALTRAKGSSSSSSTSAGTSLNGNQIDPQVLVRLVFAVINRQITDILATLFRICGKDGNGTALHSKELHSFWHKFTKFSPCFVGVDHQSILHHFPSLRTPSTSTSTQTTTTVDSSAILSFVDVIREPLYQPDPDESEAVEADYCGEISLENSSNSMYNKNHNNKTFRKVISKQGIARGVTVLKESPYAFTLTKATLIAGAPHHHHHHSHHQPSRQHHVSVIDTSSSLLMEHFYLATSLFQQRYQNPVKYRKCCESLCSGSLFHSHDTNERNSSKHQQKPRYPLCSYAPRTLFLMSIICTLYCYLQEIYQSFSIDSFSLPQFLDELNRPKCDASWNTTHGEPMTTQELLERRKDTVIKNSYELFQLLMKLPINTHAITQVVQHDDRGCGSTNSSNSMIVTTKVIGYAIFLTASAINHSCSPNAVVKYCGESVSTLIDSSTEQSARRIDSNVVRNLELQIIVSESAVRYGEEITISYGVLARKDPLVMRQEVLEKQYLFQCHCSACAAEFMEKERLVQEQKGKLKKDMAKVRGRYIDVNTENVKEYCRKMHQYRSELEILNVAFTEILSQCKEEVDMNPLERFHSQNIEPFQRKLDSLRDILSSPLEIFWQIVMKSNTSMHSKEEQLSEIDGDICKEYAQLYCTLLDMSAHLEGTRGQFVIAAEKVALAIRIFVQARIYSENDIVIGRERVKLAGLLFNAGEIKSCHDIIQSAMDSLIICANDQDPDVIQAKQLLYFTSRLIPR